MLQQQFILQQKRNMNFSYRNLQKMHNSSFFNCFKRNYPDRSLQKILQGFCIRLQLLFSNIKREMTNKYYHNDYKKMMGVDQTRTASEKLLDKAIGGFRKTQQTIEKVVEKKIKQENKNLTSIDIFNKLAKNIDNNKNAVRILKPLNILKKCLNDQTFITNAQVNNLTQWIVIVNLVIESDDKLVGNYSEIGLVIDCLADIFASLLICLKKLKGQSDEVKQQSHEQGVKQEQKNDFLKINDLNQCIQICEIHLIYLKLYTDDNFAFNKLLSEFKSKYNNYFEIKLNGKAEDKERLYAYLERLLMKLFNLPHSKYEWVKQSLAQFFKQFNILYKQLLKEEQVNKYLKTYNDFLNQKIGKGQGGSVNIFGNGGKGGNVATVQIVPADGLDKWTSKQ